MSEIEAQLTDFLNKCCQAERLITRPAGYYGFHEFLLRHGKFMPIHPSQPKFNRARAKGCYYYGQEQVKRNQGLKEENTLIYCEGLAVSDRCPLPVMHGWCCNQSGQVVDPTWSSNGVCYFGVSFNYEWITKLKAARKAKGHGHVCAIIEGNYLDDDVLFLKSRAKDWQAVI